MLLTLSYACPCMRAHYATVSGDMLSVDIVVMSAVVPAETPEPTAEEAASSGARSFAAVSLSALAGVGCVLAFSI